jgi:D-amino-acid dehydrogenase
MENPRTAIVVGAGIVGICTAIELRRRGWAVTLVDRQEPGHGCSYGNAGILAAHAVVPIALPGLMAQVPRMLLDPEGPLVLRWTSLPHTWRWLMRLRSAANLPQVRRTAAAMHQLYASAVQRHLALAREAGVPELVSTDNGLYVHRDVNGIDLDNGLAWQLRREHGARIEVLEGAALHEAEPELSRAYTRGVRMGPMGHSVNPLRLTQAYAALLRALGGSIERDDVRALQASGASVRVATANGQREADAVVLATGAWSSALVRPLGFKLPLIAERGYHLTYADPGIRLNHVVSEIGAHFAVTSMEPGLRVAGTEEIGLADDAPSWRRAVVLHAHARRLFPNANLGRPSRWMGPRPGTPDSLPVIGALPGHSRIFIAAGHGHLGLTGAPHTGHIVARIVSGEPAEIDLAAFAPGRFDG